MGSTTKGSITKGSTTKGFTLVEVMIAMMIVAVALPALIYRIQSVVDHTSYVEQKTYAYWIAENKLQEVLLVKRLQKIVPKSRQNDKVDFAGEEWEWEIDVEETPLEGMYRFDIRVGKGDNNWLASLAGFINE